MFKCIKTTTTQNKNSVNLYQSPHTTGKKVLIIAGTHGDEPQGTDILSLYIKENITCKNNLYIIPCVNPDGYEQKLRTNSNNVDLNRNFPTENWELTEKNEFFGGNSPSSEIETQFLVEIITEIKPDIILTIHAPFKIVNYDGPAENISKQIAKIIDYPVQHDIGYPTPGSFGTYCGLEKNIPTITLELGEDEAFNWQKDRCYKILELLANQY
ncbi:DUF2817 domain-containing protein [bacterium]|nr:DUF2817 domain-containing protein [bacterium]